MDEDKIKQVIVMRKDLNMRKGKMVAQGSHASMKIFFDRMIYNHGVPHAQRYEQFYYCNFTEEMIKWMNGAFTKVCVSVNSEEELLSLKDQAEKAGIPVSLITDSGLTEFNGIPTNTCIAIGPDLSSRIDLITGGLPLL